MPNDNNRSEILQILSPPYGVKYFPFFYGPINVEEQLFFHSCHTPDVTRRNFRCTFRIEIKLAPINPFKLGF